MNIVAEYSNPTAGDSHNMRRPAVSLSNSTDSIKSRWKNNREIEDSRLTGRYLVPVGENLSALQGL